jgi:hypothetical protein
VCACCCARNLLHNARYLECICTLLAHSLTRACADLIVSAAEKKEAQRKKAEADKAKADKEKAEKAKVICCCAVGVAHVVVWCTR